MRERRVGIIMNGVTGRMGLNQHLIRSILAIREQGGVALGDGSVLMPDPILVGRNEEKLKAIAGAHGLARWTTDLTRALDNPEDTIYFDSGATGQREQNVLRGDRGREARLLREATRDHAQRRAGDGAGRGEGRRETAAWCRTSCFCRACANCDDSSMRLLWPHSFGARRIWLLGL